MTELLPLPLKPNKFSKFLKQAKKYQQVKCSSTILKRLSSLLLRKKICEAHLVARKTALIQVNFAKLDTQPIIKVKINNIDFSSTLDTLDTGSSYTIIPAKHFQQLKIPISQLNSDKNYSIQSASQMVKNAVQGTITLPLKIQNLDNSFQIINQTFLVLRETLTLPTILLGNDFLQANQSQITYDKN